MIESMEHIEYPESGDRHKRPTFDRNQPETLFAYGNAMAQYYRSIVEEHGWPNSIEHLADELDAHITNCFETLPLVTVVGDDISYTQDIRMQGQDRLIEIGTLPLVGDAEIMQVHTLNGYLYGFHMGENNDLRAYVSINDGARKLMGGIYTPLLSIGMESNTTEISLTETVTETELERIGKEMSGHLNALPQIVKGEVTRLLEAANVNEPSVAKKLHTIGPIIAAIARFEEVTPQFIETLFEYTKYRLGLFMPHDIETVLHRQKLPTVAYSFKPIKQQKVFENVTPTFELIGETKTKSLGLVLIANGVGIQIPVEYITSMYRTQ